MWFEKEKGKKILYTAVVHALSECVSYNSRPCTSTVAPFDLNLGAPRLPRLSDGKQLEGANHGDNAGREAADVPSGTAGRPPAGPHGYRPSGARQLEVDVGSLPRLCRPLAVSHVPPQQLVLPGALPNIINCSSFTLHLWFRSAFLQFATLSRSKSMGLAHLFRSPHPVRARGAAWRLLGVCQLL